MLRCAGGAVLLSKILSGTLANDPIKTCITTEFTGDYTPRSTAGECATLADTVEKHTVVNGVDYSQANIKD